MAEFHITSPLYPEDIPAGLNCDYVVEPASDSVCGLDLDLGAVTLPTCPSDQLVVGGRQICGENPGTLRVPFQRPGTPITFRGQEHGGPGFNVTVRQRECNSREDISWCGGEFSAETIVITSPGYPLSYPENLDCSYIIRPNGPGVCQVQIGFENSEIENSANCVKDRLEINVDQVCGELRGMRTYIVGEGLDIRFTSDSDGSAKGFKLIAKQVKCMNNNNVIILNPSENDKQDVLDECYPQIQENNPPSLLEGYPAIGLPFPPFSLPNEGGNLPSRGYLPPKNYENHRIPLEQDPPVLPPFSQYSPRNFPPYPSYQPISTPSNIPTVQSVQNAPSPRYRPFEIFQFYPPFYQNLGSNLPFPPISTSVPNFRPVQTSGDQCCGHVYSDSHFLLASPGFPRSQSVDCIYPISRFSPISYQLRFQFRYFWVGVDTGTGCSGGYLEIDGTRICGCKTGLVWTSQFFDSETSKTLHLRLDSSNDRLFNGFVIEVYQDDSYSQRYTRAESVGSGDTNITRGNVSNITQYVETIVERNPVLIRGEDYQLLDRSPGELQWDTSRQPWSLSTDLFCLRWSLQDWLVLAKEALWARYQCPTMSSTSVVGDSRNDGLQSTACRTCQYICRQNCQCC